MRSIDGYLPARHWLFKTEPNAFSFDDLMRDKQTRWDGVRNYQARNFMRDHVQVGDQVIFYHSNANPSGAVGTAVVVKGYEPDTSALNPQSPYFDARSRPENPVWGLVTIGKPQPLKQLVSLEDMRGEPALADMLVLRKGQRLSILPLSEEEYEGIVRLAGGHT